MASTVLERPTKHRTTNRTKTIHTPTTDAIAILQKRFGSPESDAYMVEELERILIGNQIYELRTKAGMTQSALAKKAGTKAGEIDRLENADYEGHPLPLLRKIADVFGMRIEINFVPQS
jgi:DNA-binding XRE family transcriptional regulator